MESEGYKNCDICQQLYSCRYLRERFSTDQCNFYQTRVDALHRIELEERKEMLKVTNNYGRDI